MPVRWSKARQGVVWPRQTNVWREVTSPARGFRRLTRDRQRGAIPSARRQLGVPVAGSALPVFHRPLAARNRGERAGMRAIIRTSIVALAVACCASAYAQTLTGTARILDADTILIGSERIRLQGVDAPETDQICLDRSRRGLELRDRRARPTDPTYWIARDFLRHQRQRCFRSVARDLLHKRGRPECVASSRGPRRGFHPILQSVCR